MDLREINTAKRQYIPWRLLDELKGFEDRGEIVDNIFALNVIKENEYIFQVTLKLHNKWYFYQMMKFNTSVLPRDLSLILSQHNLLVSTGTWVQLTFFSQFVIKYLYTRSSCQTLKCIDCALYIVKVTSILYHSL